MDIKVFWRDVISQNREALQAYFCKDAVIHWHCTNEKFSVQEYIKVNCDYQGEWEGEIERIEKAGETLITAVQVLSKDKKISCYVVSFIKLKDDLISEMDEYWVDDGKAPEWRLNLRIGTPIK
ncbi:MAG: nuclear transport factor 2 family protein [Christensenellales bacterium]